MSKRASSVSNVSQGIVLCVLQCALQCVLQCVLQYVLQYVLQHLSIFELEDIVSLGNTVPKFIHDDVLTGKISRKSAFQSFLLRHQPFFGYRNRNIPYTLLKSPLKRFHCDYPVDNSGD